MLSPVGSVGVLQEIMTTIPVLHSNTQVHIPGVGDRDAKCLAGGYVALCKVPTNEPASELSEGYNPTRGIKISTMMTGPDGWVELTTIGPDQRNAAIAQWWLDNCWPAMQSIMEGFPDNRADTANGFGWWLTCTTPRVIQVDGWARDTWRGFASDILADVEKNRITFRQAAGIDYRPETRELRRFRRKNQAAVHHILSQETRDAIDAIVHNAIAARRDGAGE